MPSSSSPNVVCFIADQLRHDHLGCMGNDTVETPNVDSLADSGVTFDRAYVNNPMCMPARATLFTGQNPHRHGVRANGIPLDPDIPTVSGTLAEAGYRTHAAGKMHFHLYTLPVQHNVVHVHDQLRTRSLGPFADRLGEAIETVLREVLEVPEEIPVGDVDPDRQHEGFSSRADDVVMETMEQVHVPKWSTVSLVLQRSAAEASDDWPCESFTDAEWERFEAALADRLGEIFDKLGCERYEDVDFGPEEFPESRELWESRRLSDLPEPFYGFDTVDFTGGHVNEIFGEYKDWLRETHPDSYERFDYDHPDNVRGRTFQVLDHWSLPETHHYNHWISDRIIDFIDEAAGSEEPFFAYCSYPDPHNPYAVPDPWGDMYDPDEVELPTRREGELDDLPPFFRDVYENDFFQLQSLYTDPKPEVQADNIREIIATTYGMVSYLDHQVGRVLSALEERGLREDTIVLFLSDHGDVMGDHWMNRKGPFQFESLLRVPMIWSWPGEFPEGRRIDSLTSHVDVMPTLLDCCGAPDPHGSYVPPYREDPPALPGKSLKPLLTGDRDAIDDTVVVENDADYLGLQIRTLVTDRYKLTYYPGEEYGELYDLQEDPGELHNRWDDPDYADLKARLKGELLEALVQKQEALPPRSTIA